MERNNGCFWCSFAEDDGKKVKKYAIPIVTVAGEPTVYLYEVKKWKESRRRQAKGPPTET